MERDVFIGGEVDYAAGLTEATGGKWTASALTEKGICLFNQDGTIIDGSATVVAGDITGDTFSIGLMTPYGIKYSVDIDRSSFKYTKLAYVAPVAAVKYLGDDTATSAGSYSLNLPSTISVGDVYGVSIRDRSKSHEDSSAIINYTLNVVTGDVTTGKIKPNIITKLVAAINANDNSIVTAVAMNDGTDNDGIRFTANTAGVDFDIILMDGILSSAQVVEYKVVDGTYASASTTAVANNPGTGTPAQAAIAELDATVQSGNINSPKLGNYMWSETSLVDTSLTYTVYSLYFTTPAGQPARDAGFKQLIQLFIPSGETSADEPITVLDEIFALINP